MPKKSSLRFLFRSCLSTIPCQISGIISEHCSGSASHGEKGFSPFIPDYRVQLGPRQLGKSLFLQPPNTLAPGTTFQWKHRSALVCAGVLRAVSLEHCVFWTGLGRGVLIYSQGCGSRRTARCTLHPYSPSRIADVIVAFCSTPRL
jgi:hypothetical protein